MKWTIFTLTHQPRPRPPHLKLKKKTRSSIRPVALAPSDSDQDTSPTSPPLQRQLAPSRRWKNDRSERKQRAREAKKLQRLYRTNKKKCIWLILGEESPRCKIPISDLQSHFSTTTSPTADTQAQSYLWPHEPDDPDDLTFEVHPEEVTNQFIRLSVNLAPGPDGVP